MAQQSPRATHEGSHQQFPPSLPHSQLEHAFGFGAQSLEHVHSSSPASHRKFPHTGAQLPHAEHAFAQQSPRLTHCASQKQLPPLTPHWQAEQDIRSSGQSLGQEHDVSPASHWPLPQTIGHAPQSPGQFAHVSPASQLPLPHTAGHTPQSCAQLVQVSPASQVPLEHAAGQGPQSAGQLLHVSCGASHALSPQAGPGVPPLPPDPGPPPSPPVPCAPLPVVVVVTSLVEPVVLAAAPSPVLPALPPLPLGSPSGLVPPPDNVPSSEPPLAQPLTMSSPSATAPTGRNSKERVMNAPRAGGRGASLSERHSQRTGNVSSTGGRLAVNAAHAQMRPTRRDAVDSPPDATMKSSIRTAFALEPSSTALATFVRCDGEIAGAACEFAADCHTGVGGIVGSVQCLDRTPNGYCTHERTDNADVQRQVFADRDLGCIFSGGGSENRKVCFPPD